MGCKGNPTGNAMTDWLRVTLTSIQSDSFD
jgi:hypothetical protein